MGGPCLSGADAPRTGGLRSRPRRYTLVAMRRRTSRLAALLLTVTVMAHAAGGGACEVICASSGMLADAKAASPRADTGAADCHGAGAGDHRGSTAACTTVLCEHGDAANQGAIAERSASAKAANPGTTIEPTIGGTAPFGQCATPSLRVSAAPPGSGLYATVPLRV